MPTAGVSLSEALKPAVYALSEIHHVRCRNVMNGMNMNEGSKHCKKNLA
jgi:hypothetical protein